MGNDGARAPFFRRYGDLVHEIIIVIRVMVKNHKLRNPGRIAQVGAGLPCGMTPAGTVFVFVLGKHGIVYYQVGAMNQTQNILIQLAGNMFRIG